MVRVVASHQCGPDSIPAQGPVSRKSRQLLGPVKPFLDHLYLKTEKFIRLKRLARRDLPSSLEYVNEKSSVVARSEILLWLYGPETFPGLSGKDTQVPFVGWVCCLF